MFFKHFVLSQLMTPFVVLELLSLVEVVWVNEKKFLFPIGVYDATFLKKISFVEFNSTTKSQFFSQRTKRFITME